MPSSVRAVLAAADVEYGGRVRWGQPVPSQEPGVYLVSLSNAPESLEGTLPAAPLNRHAAVELVRARPEMTVDKQSRDGAETLLGRVAEFWLPDENILYIGLAGTSLQQRVNAYYSTKLGRRSPHAGGWFLKLLDNLDQFHVHYAATEDPSGSEERMLAAFVGGVSAKAKQALRDPSHPFPFANLEWPKGVRKAHGIQGATGGPGPKQPILGTPPTKKSKQTYPRSPDPSTKVEHINRFLQDELGRRERHEVAAVEAARWLDAAGLLTDSDIRPGLPLRDLLRARLISGQRQEPNRRWFIDRV